MPSVSAKLFIQKISHANESQNFIIRIDDLRHCQTLAYQDSKMTGVKRIFPTAREVIAPTGNDFHWLRGTFSLASADPRHINPSGTLAAPINVAAS